jgi:hypothetical protein
LRGVRVSRGASLVELVLTLGLGSVVLMAAGRVALSARRFWFAEREALAARHALRSAAAILTAELRAISPAAGDLLSGSDTAITIRAARGLYQSCRTSSGGTALTVRRDDALAPATPEPGRDAVRVLLAADHDSADRWLRAELASVASTTCPDGAPALRFLLEPGDSPEAFASVVPGAPVRLFETVTYRLYNDGSGAWWLGVRTWQGGSWAATSPLAGPFTPRTGLAVSFRDGSGNIVPPDSTVRAIGILLRVTGTAPIQAAGWRAGLRTDSLAALVAPRNP